MKKSISSRIIFSLVITALTSFIIGLITNNEIFNGIMFLCLGAEFIIINNENSKVLDFMQGKLQKISGLLLSAIGFSIIIKYIIY